MPHVSEPLPPALRESVFLHRDGVAAGATRKRLRSPDLDARVYGVRVTGASADDLRVRCRAFAARLGSGAFFSHSTAARLLGVPLPLRLERLQRLHVTVEAPARAPHARGVIGHSRQVAPDDVIRTPDGIRVSSPTRMWCEMAPVLDLADLVAVTDHVIHHRRGWAAASDLAERLQFGDRLSRHPLLRRAIELSSPRAESRPESRLRVYCAAAGLPEPSVNHEHVDTEAGRHRRLDLAWPDRRFAIEYQWRRDMTRRENLRLAGWTILELNADDLADPPLLIARIRTALAT